MPIEVVTDSTRPWALKELPPFPAVALRIMELLSKQEVETQQVIALISADPAFAAELLRVANSALFALSQEVRSVKQGVLTLGFDLTKSMAMTVAFRGYLKNAMKIPILRRCWRHCLACGIISEQIARAVEHPGGDAYTAGLLHDIGRLGLLAGYPASYANALEVSIDSGIGLLECERELFDLDHTEAGRWLASEWSLPAEIAEVIGRHHDPHLSPDLDNLVSIVALGCRMSDAFGWSAVPAREFRPVESISDDLPEEVRGAMDCYALFNSTEERIAMLE